MAVRPNLPSHSKVIFFVCVLCSPRLNNPGWQGWIGPLPSHHTASTEELSERPSILGSAGCTVGCSSAVGPGAAVGSALRVADGDAGRVTCFLAASWWQRVSLSLWFFHCAKSQFNLQPLCQSSLLKTIALVAIN